MSNAITRSARTGKGHWAWSRIDLDLETGGALIEEVQSDWVRDKGFKGQRARWDRRYAKWKHYVEEQLTLHLKTWDEAMLAATLWFLYREIGIGQIFYHPCEAIGSRGRCW